MSSSVYCLYCSVCKSSFNSRSTWLTHLCQEGHQSITRKDCFWWWDAEVDKLHNDNERWECTVALFSSCSLTTSVLESLLCTLNCNEEKMLNFLVTDLVWWPKERDKFACFQLESRRMVDLFFQCRLEDGCNLQIGNNFFQMKRTMDLLKLELKALLPPQPQVPGNTSSVISPIIKMTTTNNYDNLPVVGVPQSSVIPEPNTPLQLQFNLICNSIEIPDHQLNYALKIINILQSILTKLHPSGKLTMFRNYFLRLWNMASNTLLINGYIAANPANPNRFLLLDRETEMAIFNSSHFKNKLSEFSPTRIGGAIDGGNPYIHQTTNFRFHFISFPLTIVETQLCSLVQYFCSFDNRVKPLFTLLHFWAKSNNVRIAEKNISVPATIYNCPEPIAFEWLIILFLSHEKVIPTVRQILELPHTPILVHKSDVGFSRDPDFPKKWKEENGRQEDVTSDKFILEVAQLAKLFFQFYSTKLVDSDKWLLNPKDAQVIKRKKKDYISTSKLIQAEQQDLIRNQGTKLAKQWNLVIKPYKYFMINPLCITWRLSFCVKTWRHVTRAKMREAGKRLEGYLSRRKGNGEDNLMLALSGVEDDTHAKINHHSECGKRKLADYDDKNPKKRKLV